MKQGLNKVISDLQKTQWCSCMLKMQTSWTVIPFFRLCKTIEFHTAVLKTPKSFVFYWSILRINLFFLFIYYFDFSFRTYYRGKYHWISFYSKTSVSVLEGLTRFNGRGHQHFIRFFFHPYTQGKVSKLHKLMNLIANFTIKTLTVSKYQY